MLSKMSYLFSFDVCGYYCYFSTGVKKAGSFLVLHNKHKCYFVLNICIIKVIAVTDDCVNAHAVIDQLLGCKFQHCGQGSSR